MGMEVRARRHQLAGGGGVGEGEEGSAFEVGGQEMSLEIQPVEGTQPANTENTQMEKSKMFTKPHTQSAGMTGTGLERTSRLWPQSLATR